MLKTWSLGGFKAFGDTADLQLSPLTILAGANSSGKSTILQSILLLKQTLQYGASTRPLALNGPLIRLGTFDDVLHAPDTAHEISISFSLDVDASSSATRTPWANKYRLSSIDGLVPRSVSGSFVWSPRPVHSGGIAQSYDQLKAVLRHGDVRVTLPREREDGAPDERYASYRSRGELYDVDLAGDDNISRWMDVDFDALTADEITHDKPGAVIGLMALNYFLPWYVSVSYDAGKKRALEVAESIFGGSLLSQVRLEGQRLSGTVLDTINEWLLLRNEKPIEDEGGVNASAIAERLRSRRSLTNLLQSGRSRTTVDPAILELQAKIEAILLDEAPPSRENELAQPRVIESTSEYLRTFFTSGVRYLGPLRDEPRPVYPLEALENPTDVGYRGEHTAAVLYLNGDTFVRYTRPMDGGVHSAALKTAVAEWLTYLGVATDVIASDAGVFGNQLQVKTEGVSKAHHLTNVGVGVSQVLPIVVSSLIAPPTSLLIFEQPELHLHPGVQARLADFFIAMSEDYKQCLIETHSEYMIDRFRRRVAESDSDEIKALLSIFFTERVAGTTRCRPVTLTEYGAIVDWPKDFFEQGQIESRKILEAAAAKRARQKAKI